MKSTFMFIDMSELSVAEEYMFLNSDTNFFYQISRKSCPIDNTSWTYSYSRKKIMYSIMHDLVVG